jgi:hypothetical protein
MSRQGIRDAQSKIVDRYMWIMHMIASLAIISVVVQPEISQKPANIIMFILNLILIVSKNINSV